MVVRLKALAYVRVSTSEQVDQGFGLAAQERAIRTYVRANNLRLVDIERDEGLSGGDGIDTRRGLASVLARLEAGEADLLLVSRADRLARDLLVQETVIERLRAAGRNVVSVAEPDLTGDDPTRVLIRQVLGAIAQYERGVIRGRMMAGKAAKLAAGGYVGGRPRYGHRADDGKLIADRAEQRLIKRARELRSDGRSLRQVGTLLAAEGYRPRRGDTWHPTTISRLIEETTSRPSRSRS